MAHETYTEESARAERERILANVVSWSEQTARFILGHSGALYGLAATDADAALLGPFVASNIAQDTYHTPADIPPEVIHSTLRIAAMSKEVSVNFVTIGSEA